MITLNRITNLSEFRLLNLSGDISSLESVDYGQRTVFRKVAELSLLERLRCSRFTSGHVGLRIFQRTWSVLVLSERLNTLHVQETY